MGVFFALAFWGVGVVIEKSGWRTAWLVVASFLVVVVMPMALLFFAGKTPAPTTLSSGNSSQTGYSLTQALQTPAFWIFAGAAALFNFVSSGFGLFNESILAERGFDQKTFHVFLGVSALFTLAGQGLCGWLSKKLSYRSLVAIALALYAMGLCSPGYKYQAGLILLSFVIGSAGGMIIVYSLPSG